MYDLTDSPASTSRKQPHTMATAAQPVDVETQCGALLPSGAQCTGALACKRHSMFAKRAVAGRSAPFDQLLRQCQEQRQTGVEAAGTQAS